MREDDSDWRRPLSSFPCLFSPRQNGCKICAQSLPVLIWERRNGSGEHFCFPVVCFLVHTKKKIPPPEPTPFHDLLNLPHTPGERGKTLRSRRSQMSQLPCATLKKAGGQITLLLLLLPRKLSFVVVLNFPLLIRRLSWVPRYVNGFFPASPRCFQVYYTSGGSTGRSKEKNFSVDYRPIVFPGRP